MCHQAVSTAGSFILYVILAICPIHSNYVIACLICKLLFCRAYNIKLRDIYSDLTDEALDEALQNIIGLNRSVGAEGARARLRSHGITVPRQRVRDAMECIDPAEDLCSGRAKLSLAYRWKPQVD